MYTVPTAKFGFCSTAKSELLQNSKCLEVLPCKTVRNWDLNYVVLLNNLQLNA